MVRHTGEDFIDVEGITVASVLSLQSAGVNGTKFDTPKADRFSTDGDPALSEQIFDITMAEIETIVEPESLPHEVLWVQHRK